MQLTRKAFAKSVQVRATVLIVPVLDDVLHVDGCVYLHQVKDHRHLLGTAQLNQLLQETIFGLDHGAVQQDRLHDDRGDLLGVLGEVLLHAVEVVEFCDQRQVGDLLGDAAAERHTGVLGTHFSGTCVHRDPHGVVMAVIATLDLNDVLAGISGASQPDGVQSGFGAGVKESPERKREPLHKNLGGIQQIWGREGN